MLPVWSIFPCLSFSSSLFSSVTLQISSSASNSPLVLARGGLWALPLASHTYAFVLTRSSCADLFPFRKNEFQGQLCHPSSEDGPASSKKTLPICCFSRLQCACSRQSFGKCQMWVSCYQIYVNWGSPVSQSSWIYQTVIRKTMDASNGSKASWVLNVKILPQGWEAAGFILPFFFFFLYFSFTLLEGAGPFLLSKVQHTTSGRLFS